MSDGALLRTNSGENQHPSADGGGKGRKKSLLLGMGRLVSGSGKAVSPPPALPPLGPRGGPRPPPSSPRRPPSTPS